MGDANLKGGRMWMRMGNCRNRVGGRRVRVLGISIFVVQKFEDCRVVG